MSLPIYYAPLQGFTEDVYRVAHMQLCGGVDEYYTPFMRIEHGELRKKDSLDVRPEHNCGVPLALQVIASGADEMALLLEAVEAQRSEWLKKERHGEKSTWADCERVRIDVNMGCPFPLQVKHGRGAGILLHPEKVGEVCDFISQHADYDFSVKMRLGVECSEEWHKILPMLNDVPLKHITLHPRVAKQQYNGVPDMLQLEYFAAECRHPLVYNGDITSVDQLIELETRYPQLAGVMIGRGLLARPSLAWEYKTGTQLSNHEVRRLLCRMHDIVRQHYAARIPGESQQLNKLRTFWEYAEPTIGRKVWKKLLKAGNMKNYLAAVDTVSV